MQKIDKSLDELYFEYLVDLACGNRFSKSISFGKLLRSLHETEFYPIIENDSNRAEDGIDLRYRFAIYHYGYYVDEADEVIDQLKGPCSILEMMLALAIRCEDDIMDNTLYGDRTGNWFWGMVVNLGLGSMTDDRFDEGLFRDIIKRFLERDYEPNGNGGLFTVRYCEYDLRNVEIWDQLLWYLNTIS